MKTVFLVAVVVVDSIAFHLLVVVQVNEQVVQLRMVLLLFQNMNLVLFVRQLIPSFFFFFWNTVSFLQHFASR
jgi:hypothetical protein